MRNYAIIAVLGMLAIAAPASAQQYTLLVPDQPHVRSQATLTPTQLLVRNNGRTFRYLRARRLDTPDGQYLGFHSLLTGRRLRFPASGNGQLLTNDGGRTWTPSRMRVVATVAPYVVDLGYGQYQTVSQEIRYVANPPLAPVAIALRNSHQKDVLVGLVDRRTKKLAKEVLVKAGGTVLQSLERDAGGYLEIRLVRTDGTLVRVLDRISVPPQPLYDAGVYEYSVVSSYYDYTQKGPEKFKPVSQRKGTISLGVFPLPAVLVANASLDVYQTAKQQQNPGAVRLVPALKRFDR